MARQYTMPVQSKEPDVVVAEDTGFKKFMKAHWKIFPIVLVAGTVISATAFGIIRMQERNEDAVITKTWDGVKDIANDVTTDSDITLERGQMYSSDPMNRLINWDGVLEIDPNIKCWIYIPDASVDYPVAQPAKWSDNQYYLSHDVYGKNSSAGTIYMPAEIEGFEDTDMHQIIIGHNMRNGSMFSNLTKYKDKGFWEATPYIYLYYPDRTEKWLIYSPYHTTQADAIYNMPYEAGTALYKDLLSQVEANKAYDTATNGPTVNSPLLTLTTCDRTSTEGADGRFVVNAKLVDTVVLKSDESASDEVAVNDTQSQDMPDMAE